jgi:hypothetical protein
MSKVIKYGLVVLLVLALAGIPAYANLVPTTFGFPVIVQNGSTCAFNQDTAKATDFENIDINFPAYFDGLHLGASTLGLGIADAETEQEIMDTIDGVGVGVGTDGADPTGVAVAVNDAEALGIGATLTANVLPFGPVNLAFPDIEQTVYQKQEVTHCDFAQTNEYAEFAYPFVGVGPVALPGFGFGW